MLKEFEKWYEMEGQNLVGVGRITDLEFAQEVWKAALQWVLSNTDVADSGEYI